MTEKIQPGNAQLVRGKGRHLPLPSDSSNSFRHLPHFPSIFNFVDQELCTSSQSAIRKAGPVALDAEVIYYEFADEVAQTESLSLKKCQRSNPSTFLCQRRITPCILRSSLLLEYPSAGVEPNRFGILGAAPRPRKRSRHMRGVEVSEKRGYRRLPRTWLGIRRRSKLARKQVQWRAWPKSARRSRPPN